MSFLKATVNSTIFLCGFLNNCNLSWVWKISSNGKKHYKKQHFFCVIWGPLILHSAYCVIRCPSFFITYINHSRMLGLKHVFKYSLKSWNQRRTENIMLNIGILQFYIKDYFWFHKIILNLNQKSCQVMMVSNKTQYLPFQFGKKGISPFF